MYDIKQALKVKGSNQKSKIKGQMSFNERNIIYLSGLTEL